MSTTQRKTLFTIRVNERDEQELAAVAALLGLDKSNAVRFLVRQEAQRHGLLPLEQPSEQVKEEHDAAATYA